MRRQASLESQVLRVDAERVVLLRLSRMTLQNGYLSLPPTLGVRPLKNDPGPSVRTISLIIAQPERLLLKLAFWIRVLTTSRGAATVIEATAPAIEATKSAVSESHHCHVSILPLTLSPGGLGVVLNVEEVLLGQGGTTEELESEMPSTLSLTANDPGALRAMVQPQPR